MKKMNIITRMLCNCAGADTTTLNQCNSAEQKKIAIIGSCVLITPLIGIASGTFAILTFSNSLPVSLAFGLLWGLIIFIIDRAVVSNTRPGEFNLGVVARIMLAAIFALVIAVPMELKVFEDAIREKLAINLSSTVNLVNKDIDQKISGIQSGIAKDKEKVDELRLSYIGEVDGSSGSKVANRGPIALEKEKLWIQEVTLFEIMSAEKQKEIENLNNQRLEKIATITDTQAHGFLGRMRALGKLSEEDKTVWWGIWLIRLFFLSIELTPILIKLSSGRNGNAYYEIVQQNGEMAIIVNQQLSAVRADEMVKQQRALVNMELLELQFSHEKSILDNAQKRFELYMSQVKKSSERKLQLLQHVITTVEEESLRNRLLSQIEEIYDDFMSELSRLLNRKPLAGDFINNL